MLDFLRKTYLKLKFFLLKKALLRSGVSIIDEDPRHYTYLVQLSEDSSILVSLEDQGKIIRLETALIFDSSIVNLKTLSSVAHIAFLAGFGITGISNKSLSEAKIYFGKEVNFFGILNGLGREVSLMQDSLGAITAYLQLRMSQLDPKTLDLSMFDDIDLYLFNPQFLGEQKEFVHKNWGAFMKHIIDNAPEGLIDVNILVSEVQACAEFEAANGLLLSEIGNEVLQEIIWNRKMAETALESKYSIN